MQEKVVRVPYVEFVGLPGSGKSTISRHLIEKLLEDGYRVVDQGGLGTRVWTRSGVSDEAAGWRSMGRLRRVLKYVYLHIRFSRIAYNGYRLVANAPNRSVASDAVRRLLQLLYRLDRASTTVATCRADLVLFDQGIINYIREIVGSRNDASASSRMERLLASVSLVTSDIDVTFCYIDLGTTKSISRLMSRTKKLGRYDRMARSELNGEFRGQRQVLQRLAQSFADHSASSRFIALDGNRDPQENAAILMASITGHCMTGYSDQLAT